MDRVLLIAELDLFKKRLNSLEGDTKSFLEEAEKAADSAEGIRIDFRNIRDDIHNLSVRINNDE